MPQACHTALGPSSGYDGDSDCLSRHGLPGLAWKSFGGHGVIVTWIASPVLALLADAVLCQE